MGFLYGWMRFTVIIPANIGAMAFIFAEHARRLGAWDSRWNAAVALAAIVMLTALNLGGVALGKGVQNALTLLKLVGLTAIVVAGVYLATNDTVPITPAQPPESINYSLALVFILYAYGGWSDAAFVASEVRDVRRNVPRALFLGLGTITVFYLLVNCAYVAGLRLDGVRGSPTPAAELLQRSWGRGGEVGVIIIVMLSTLGSINGMIFSGARLTVAVGTYHRLFALFGHADDRRNPWRAVLGLGLAAAALVWLVGTDSGKSALALVFARFGVGELHWSAGEKGFETLVTGTAPTFWVFFCLTSAAVPILRWREPHVERPFRCFSPLMPLVFGGTSLFMLWSSAAYAGSLGWVGAALLVLGAGLYLLSARRPPPQPVDIPS
jgi:amino acid transporter